MKMIPQSATQNNPMGSSWRDRLFNDNLLLDIARHPDCSDEMRDQIYQSISEDYKGKAMDEMAEFFISNGQGQKALSLIVYSPDNYRDRLLKNIVLAEGQTFEVVKSVLKEMSDGTLQFQSAKKIKDTYVNQGRLKEAEEVDGLIAEYTHKLSMSELLPLLDLSFTAHPKDEEDFSNIDYKSKHPAEYVEFYSGDDRLYGQSLRLELARRILESNEFSIDADTKNYLTQRIVNAYHKLEADKKSEELKSKQVDVQRTKVSEPKQPYQRTTTENVFSLDLGYTRKENDNALYHDLVTHRRGDHPPGYYTEGFIESGRLDLARSFLEFVHDPSERDRLKDALVNAHNRLRPKA